MQLFGDYELQTGKYWEDKATIGSLTWNKWEECLDKDKSIFHPTHHFRAKAAHAIVFLPTESLSRDL